MTAALQNVVIVLFQPQDVVNVAGVIRVMSNFGLRRLRLVEPAAYDPYRIEGIAHHTEAIAQAVERYPDLQSALADCSWVLGTSGRPRETRRERLTPRQAAPVVLQTAARQADAQVAILFGREKDGLPNFALDTCHALLTIPTDPANRSLNLAQAALVVAWELWMAAMEPAAPALPAPTGTPASGTPPLAGEVPSVVAALTADAELATGTQREGMFQALADLLLAMYPRTTDERLVVSMSHLRAILLRAAPRSDEARLLSALFAHLSRVVGHPDPLRRDVDTGR